MKRDDLRHQKTQKKNTTNQSFNMFQYRPQRKGSKLNSGLKNRMRGLPHSRPFWVSEINFSRLTLLEIIWSWIQNVNQGYSISIDFNPWFLIRDRTLCYLMLGFTRFMMRWVPLKFYQRLGSPKLYASWRPFGFCIHVLFSCGSRLHTFDKVCKEHIGSSTLLFHFGSTVRSNAGFH